jgi:putative ABC transport system permease protein
VLNGASGTRARSLLRRQLVATIALGVFAGAAAGAALGVWGIARRTANVYDRFVSYQNAATLAVFACNPDATETDIQADFQAACGTYDYADLREFMPTIDGVESASRFTLGIANVAAANNPTGGWRQLTQIAIDEDTFAAMGRPFIVHGRLADPSAASEAMVNEEAAARLHVGVGDELIVTPYRQDQFDAAGEGVEPAGGVPMRVTIVGVIRRPSDLIGRLAGDSIYEDSSSVTLGPGFWRAEQGDVANYSVAAMVRTAGNVGRGDIKAALEKRWPGRTFFYEEGATFGPGGEGSIVDAIRLQTLGLYVVAGVVALAALVFAGQALARQVRREWSDTRVLGALGMSRIGMVEAAALRAAAFVGISVAVALAVGAAVSPLGPFGIGRAAETDPGLHIDWTATAIALPIVAACVFLCAVVPVATARRRSRERVGPARSRVPLLVSSTLTAGVAMTRSRRAGSVTLASAVIGAALASAAGITAWSLVSSYDDLAAHPARYGSGWDAQVGNVGSVSQRDDTERRLASIPGINAATVLTTTGIGDDPDATLFAADQRLGTGTFGSVTAGRLPLTVDEVALGQDTMERYHAHIGDTIQLADPSKPEHPFTLHVVGRVVVNDTLTSSQPGRGALVTSEAFGQMTGDSTGQTGQTYVVWVEPGADRTATLAALKQEFPTTFLEHSIPRPVRNLGLLSSQPVLLALLVTLLASAALVHALVTSVRRGRRQIGVLKTLGFTGRQVAASVAWHASALAVAALVIGVPVGVIASRLVWSWIVDSIGLASAPVVPIGAVAVVTLVVLAVANLAAVGPGLTAARTSSAHALHSE